MGDLTIDNSRLSVATEQGPRTCFLRHIWTADGAVLMPRIALRASVQPDRRRRCHPYCAPSWPTHSRAQSRMHALTAERLAHLCQDLVRAQPRCMVVNRRGHDQFVRARLRQETLEPRPDRLCRTHKGADQHLGCLLLLDL